jgi:competence protein ComEC
MTLLRPAVLWEAGFQLSFAATLGILIYVEPVSRRAQAMIGRWAGEERSRRLARLLSEGLLVTLAAQLLTLPLLLYHFQQLAVLSPLANLLILPAQPGIMIWGGLATLAGLLWLPLGQLLALPAWLFLTYTIAVVNGFGALPFAAVRVTLTPAGVLASYLLIGLLTWVVSRGPRRAVAVAREQAPRLALTAALALALVVWQWVQTRPDGALHVTFLDVGQGDATLIRTPNGRRVLVDGGQYPSVLSSQVGRRLPYGDRRLDLVVATHPDADHVAALPEVVGRYDVGQLMTSGALAEGSSPYAALLVAAEREGVPIVAAQTGQIIHIDEGIRLQVVHCAPAGSTDNDSSVALRLSYGAFSLLLTGDAEAAAEEAMAASGLPLASTVYKAGHHGARTSSNDFFLDVVQPQTVIISAGAGNASGHPHPELLQRVALAGAVALRTDEIGTIELTTDGRQLWWEAGR